MAIYTAAEFEEFQEILEFFPKQMAGFFERVGAEKIAAMRKFKDEYDRHYVSMLARKQ